MERVNRDKLFVTEGMRVVKRTKFGEEKANVRNSESYDKGLLQVTVGSPVPDDNSLEHDNKHVVALTIWVSSLFLWSGYTWSAFPSTGNWIP